MQNREQTSFALTEVLPKKYFIREKEENKKE